MSTLKLDQVTVNSAKPNEGFIFIAVNCLTETSNQAEAVVIYTDGKLFVSSKLNQFNMFSYAVKM